MRDGGNKMMRAHRRLETKGLKSREDEGDGRRYRDEQRVGAT